MKRYFITTIALLIAIGASAQITTSERYLYQGSLINRDIMSVAEMGQFSQNLFQYGTARSMGLAGAMTSLGADGSSMMINPAGLGMYRSGDFSLTPMFTVQDSSTKGGEPFVNDGERSFSLSNMSAVINLYESTSTKLISLNLGLGYNRIADFNYSYSFLDMYKDSSIANIFSDQMTSAGITLDMVYGEDYPNWNTMPTYLWNATLGYKTGLTEPDGSNDWSSTWIDSGASIDQFVEVISEGYIGEYDIAMGGNIENKLYFGFTLGVQSLYQRLDLLYGEEYYDNMPDGDYRLLYSKFNQAIITDGVGVNLKFGLTYRPTQELRIGLAYHTPTYYSLNREYQSSMASASQPTDANTTTYITVDSPLLQDFYENKWRFNTPSRLLLGGSYTFGPYALISVDYQFDWYGNIKTRSIPMGVESYLYSNIASYYDTVNTLRIGGEIKPAPTLTLRGGYGYSSSLVGEDTAQMLLGIPTTKDIHYFSVGIGYAPTEAMRIDLTYMNQSTQFSDYTLFYSTTNPTAQSSTYSTSLKQHNIALSLVFRM